jgi:hypothetical protein
MSTQTDPNAFLMSGGAPAAKFPTIGTAVKGTVITAEVNQQTDFQSQKPKFYDDGKPMMQLVVTLQTDERDPENSDDDGTRRLFVRGQMLSAVRQAVKVSGGKLEPGGTLAVQYVSDKASDKPGRSPAKMYEAAYKPGAPASVDALLGNTPQAAGPSASELI